MAFGGKSRFEPGKAVWLGGLPAEATEDDLVDLGKQVGDCISAQLKNKGQAILVFGSEEEVPQAISLLNGAQVGDATIQADTWTSKPKGDKGGKGGKDFGGKGFGGKGGKGFDNTGSLGVMKSQFQKFMGGMAKGDDNFGKGKGKGKKGKSNRRQLDKAKTVWVGGLPEGVTEENLMELGNQAGTCTYAVPAKSGTGLLEFATEEEMAAAIPLLNGASVGDSVIEADTWAKPC